MKTRTPRIQAGIVAIAADDPESFAAVQELVRERVAPTPEAIAERKARRKQRQAGDSKPDTGQKPDRATPTDTI